MSPSIYTARQKNSMFQRPDWRWERVLHMCDRVDKPGRCTRFDDDYVRQARAYLLRWRASEDDDYTREVLFRENPGLAYAYEIHERSTDEPDVSQITQARILSRQDFAEIGKTTGMTVEAIHWYEALFFNVVQRIDQRDWILKQVLLPSAMRNAGTNVKGSMGVHAHENNVTQQFSYAFYDMSLKFFAYFGGPILVDFMLTGFRNGKFVDSVDSVGKFFEEHMKITLKRRSAQASMQFEVNKYNVMQLFETVLKITEIENSADAMDNQRNSLESNLYQMINEIPWSVGSRAQKQSKGTPLEKYDQMDAELRDDELMMVAAGETEKLGGLEGLQKLKLPPPKKKKEETVPTKGGKKDD